MSDITRRQFVGRAAVAGAVVRAARTNYMLVEPLELRRLLSGAGDVAAAPAGAALSAESFPARQMENLGRGVVAVRSSSTQAFVSWRLLGLDPAGVGFNVYRSANGAAPVKLNGAVLTGGTNFADTTANFAVANAYSVRAVVSGVEQPPSEAFTLPANATVGLYQSVPLQIPAGGTTPDSVAYTYNANDASVADLDGDGEYEIILKWDPSNSKDNSQSGYTGNVYVDAYKMNGTRLWRIDLGINIRAGAHYTQFIAYDLDGDGKAEVAMKTAPGTKDGLGNNVILAGHDPNADYRNTSGYVLSGPEYLTVFNGQTGAAMATTNFLVARGSVSNWGDSYGNRVDRFLAGVAYLDGVRPSLVMGRGYYERTTISAWNWRDGQLTQAWAQPFDTEDATPDPTYEGQGTHSLSIADVDGDGKDEIIYGAATIDDNGQALATSGLGHGDALHVSDMDPSRPGVEVFQVHEGTGSNGHWGASVRDGATGQVLVQLPVTQDPVTLEWPDVGRGVAMDIDPSPGYEFWDSYHPSIYAIDGTPLYGKGNAFVNFGAWWDGDLYRELLDGTTISNWNLPGGGRSNIDLDPASSSTFPPGVTSNNSTKSTPALSADIFGDWREEVIWRTSDNTQLRIFTTPIATSTRLVTLMHDPQYRAAIAWQNGAYNQPPHPSFFLGDGMAAPPPPNIYLAGAPTTPRVTENLDRGVVATRATSTQVFVSWRSLAHDPAGTAFNVYRSANGGAAVKLNPSPLTGGTNFTDATANATLANSYFVRPVISGVEQAPSGSYTLKANAAVEPLFSLPLRNITGTASDYYVHLSWVGDLDGDGEYDFVVDRIPNVAGLPDIVEAYKRDGTFLWAYNAGPNSLNKNNIEPSSSTLSVGNWDGVTVYDLDSDGKAEVAIRTANGATFGDGSTLSYPSNDNIQFISVLDGMTGAERARIQVPTDYLADGPMAASMGVGYLDGVNPSLVVKMKNRIGSGAFNLMMLAYDFDGALTQKWKWLRGSAAAEDGHQIRIIDVDQNGTDEVVEIGYVLNGDGTLKYSLATNGIVHGDRFHIADLDPDRPGLEGYGVQQNNPSFLTEYYYDAATGQLLHQHFATGIVDNGRGIVADVDPSHRGYEYWSFYGIYNSKTLTPGQPPVETQLTSEPNRPWPNFRIWWDGDVLSENLNNTVIDKWNPATQGTSRVSTLYNYGATETWREAPTFYGDVIGDWREEVVYEKFDHSALQIYTTQIASNTRLYSLAQNPAYRNGLTIKGYLQSHQVDYYLGDGMTTPPTPNIQPLNFGANAAPTVATPASASPGTVPGTTNLSVLGADDGGAANLAYTWTALGPGAVTYSANGTNAAKNTIATFSAAGDYTFVATIRDAAGRTTTSRVNVTVSGIFPLGWWKMDEPNGAAVSDSSGNGNHGTTVNGPVFVAGKFGNALSFDGANDYADLPNSIANSVAGSVSLWVKTGINFTDSAHLFFTSSVATGNGGGSENELHVNFLSDERIQFFIEGGAADVSVTSAGSYADNAWHHVVATWDINGNAILYVDGAQVGAVVHDATNFIGSAVTRLGRPGAATRHYSGLMDDVRLYNIPISPSQVQAIYSEGATGSITGQSFHDRNGDGVFNVASGDTAISGATVFVDSNNNGSLEGGEPTAVTDPTGAYSIGNLAAGIYVVRQVAPSQFAVANSNTATVPAGGTSAANDFANARIVYAGTTGVDDYRLRKNAAGKHEILISGSLAYTVFAAVPSLTFNLGDGDGDALTLDLVNGASVPSGGVSFDGGAGADDRLGVAGATAAETISIAAGAVTFAAGAASHANAESITFDGNGGFDTLSVTGGPRVEFPDAQQFQSLSLAGAAVVSLLPGGATTLVARGLSIGSSARLDLADNDLVLDHAPGDEWLDDVQAMLTAGANFGAWDGVGGIGTSMPDAPSGLTALGVADAATAFGMGGADTMEWSGQTIDATCVVVKYTYAGDANLDGFISGDDYAAIDFNAAAPGADGWYNGDFNYDGIISGDDYAAIDLNIVAQGALL